MSARASSSQSMGDGDYDEIWLDEEETDDDDDGDGGKWEESNEEDDHDDSSGEEQCDMALDNAPFGFTHVAWVGNLKHGSFWAELEIQGKVHSRMLWLMSGLEDADNIFLECILHPRLIGFLLPHWIKRIVSLLG
ncbi:hypothetical protein Taro_023403 [Colocasia esculenta]|uniref:Uncharacterized protein n=1 Tax=Colocasia esculenta TaxID=4460 RepID=A0A843V4K6_COLES|nr:hypothetical protein [Colocasia esculenta]